MIEIILILIPIAELGSLFLVVSAAQVIAWWYLKNFINTSVVIGHLLWYCTHFLEKLVEFARRQCHVNGVLWINPMSMQFFKLRKQFIHLPFVHFDVRAKKLFDAVCTKAQEHRYFFKLLNWSGVVDVYDIWETVC